MSEGPPISGQGAVPPPAQPAVPAGWYPHPTAPGWEAYWTGAGWGTETRAAQQAPVAPAVPEAAPAVAATEVQATEPEAAQVQPAEPQVADPLVAEPQEAQPQVVQPEVVQPEAPQVVQPQVAAAAVPAVAAAEVAQAQQPATPAPAAEVPAAAPPAATPADRSDSSLPVILCVLGAIVAIVGCFLPAATADFDIADNTLVAAGYGIAAIAAASLGAVIAAYCYVKGTRTWLPILLGLVVTGVAVYAGTAGLDNLSPEITLPNFHSVADSGSPSTGIFAVGAGGILMVLGGIGLARKRSEPTQPTG